MARLLLASLLALGLCLLALAGWPRMLARGRGGALLATNRAGVGVSGVGVIVSTLIGWLLARGY